MKLILCVKREIIILEKNIPGRGKKIEADINSIITLYIEREEKILRKTSFLSRLGRY